MSATAELHISDFYCQDRPKQQAFHSSPARYRAQIGGFGGGKTFALLMEAIRFALTVPGSNSLILRRTFPDLEKSIINLFLAKVPEWVYGGRRNYNSTKHVVNFPNGAHLYFGYCERDADLNQFLSTEFVYIGIEEAGEFSFAAWLALAARNRCPIKSDIEGNPVRPSMALATNPFGAGYAWIKSLFVDKKAYGGMTAYNPADYFMVHSNVFDNPTYASDASYMAALEMLPEAEKRKKLWGDLNVISGAYFSNFDPRAMVVPYGRIKFKPWHPRWAAQDWGFAHANVTIWCAKAEAPCAEGAKTANVIYRELVEYEKSEREIAAKMRSVMSDGEQIVNLFLSPEQFARRDSYHTVADQLGDELLRAGLPRPTRADNDRIGGWKLIYNLLASGDLFIADTCPKLIEALPLLTRDPDHIEDVLKSETEADDLGDAARYALKSYLAPGKKPQEVELDELLRAKQSNQEKFMAQMRFEQAHQKPDIIVDVPRRLLR